MIKHHSLKKCRRVHVNAMTLSLMLGALVESPQSYLDLKDKTGLHKETIVKWLRHLRSQSLVHIAGWREDALGRFIIAEFSWSPGKQDVNRPPPLTAKCRARRSYVRRTALEAIAA